MHLSFRLSDRDFELNNFHFNKNVCRHLYFTWRNKYACPKSIDGETVECQTLFFGAPKSPQMVIAAMKLKDAYSLEGKL